HPAPQRREPTVRDLRVLRHHLWKTPTGIAPGPPRRGTDFPDAAVHAAAKGRKGPTTPGRTAGRPQGPSRNNRSRTARAAGSRRPGTRARTARALSATARPRRHCRTSLAPVLSSLGAMTWRSARTALVPGALAALCSCLLALPSPATAAEPQSIHKIQHVVMITQENRSFDSYFGTFPGANGIPAGTCVPDPVHG